MHRLAFIYAAAALALAACAIDSDPANSGPADEVELDPAVAPPSDVQGVTWTRDESEQRELGRRKVANPNMTFHGGKIMPTAITKNIFWGTSWASYTGDKMTGLDTWYTGYSNSHYAGTVTEYTGANGAIGTATTHQGHLVDATAAAGGSRTATILAEVCKAIKNPDPSGNGYYAVYTDVPRGSANYCAWHASGTCGGVAVQFGFFWKLDGDPGCDPSDTSGLHSQGLAALANVTGHELSEARTDPNTSGARNTAAWYDSSGDEDGDKCAWTWGAPLITFADGTQWKVQGEWSNVAYTDGTGYPNTSGQKGCLGGE